MFLGSCEYLQGVLNHFQPCYIHVQMISAQCNCRGQYPQVKGALKGWNVGGMFSPYRKWVWGGGCDPRSENFSFFFLS